MSTKTLAEKIAVMQHYLNGGDILFNGELWPRDAIQSSPHFNWEGSDYDIYEEPKTKPSINWSHVSPEYKWMTTDEDGKTYVYSVIPTPNKVHRCWFGGGSCSAEVFSSFTPGTCDWKDSLVQRPEGE